MIFIDIGDHREHDLEIAALARNQKRPHLQAQQRRPVQRHADGTPAQRRIVFPRLPQIGQGLVGADIERAENHRLAIGLLENGLVVPHLRGQARKPAGHHEMQFGAVKPDAIGA